jgi:hypothetical protein
VAFHAVLGYSPVPCNIATYTPLVLLVSVVYTVAYSVRPSALLPTLVTVPELELDEL